jgi:hypothetical protein
MAPVAERLRAFSFSSPRCRGRETASAEFLGDPAPFERSHYELVESRPIGCDAEEAQHDENCIDVLENRSFWNFLQTGF